MSDHMNAAIEAGNAVAKPYRHPENTRNIIKAALPHLRAQVLEELATHLEALPEDGLAAYNAEAIRQYAKDTTLMNYETEEQSDLKNEISDYLGQYHGGHAEGSDLDCIEAAEHIVTSLAEPAIREMIAQEILDHTERVFGGRPDSNLFVTEMVAKGAYMLSAQIAKGDTK